MNNKNNLPLVLLLLLLIFGFFYWFQLRPTQIKTECQKIADLAYKRWATSEDEDGDGMIPRSSIKVYQERSETEYKNCLHKNGL